MSRGRIMGYIKNFKNIYEKNLFNFYLVETMEPYIFFFIFSFFSLFGYEHTVSIAAIFRDEAPYLKEWIEFHLAIGVDHFYLTNHESQDDYLSVLKPYIDEGKVDLFQISGNPDSKAQWDLIQGAAYLKSAEFALNQTEWMAFIDIDEFIFPVKDLNIKKFINRYQSYQSLCINWLEFGTSFIDKLDPHRLMLDQLVLRQSVGSKIVKNIVKLKYMNLSLEAFTYAHIMPLKRGVNPVDMNGKVVCELIRSETYLGDIIRIHHYALRDEAFFQNVKMNRPNVVCNEEKKNQLYAKRIRTNQKFDNSISIIADKIRKKIFSNENSL